MRFFIVSELWNLTLSVKDGIFHFKKPNLGHIVWRTQKLVCRVNMEGKKNVVIFIVTLVYGGPRYTFNYFKIWYHNSRDIIRQLQMCFHVWANLFRFTKPSHWAPCSIYCMWKVKKCCEATHTHKRKSEREKLRQTPFPLSPYFLFEQQYPRLCAGHNTGNTLDCVQAECDIRDYGKKVHNLEIEFDETNDKLQKAIGRKATGK